VLRGFPESVVKGCRGNKYTTTIHALVSGIRKLQKIAKVPEGGLVYRGVGDMKLDEAFVRVNEMGYSGVGFLMFVVDGLLLLYVWPCVSRGELVF
jgi:hypothetical protein